VYGLLPTSTKNIFVLKSTSKYHTVPWLTNPQFSPPSLTARVDASLALRYALEEAVYKRMLTDRPVAALLSGGLDSSLIASLVQMNLKQLKQPPLKTFSIGFEGSSDLKHARIVADWIGSDHTEIVMTADEFFNAIPEVIEAIESYDTTTVRASVGNYLIAKKIRSLTDCKVVFNGDGSDELFGGYLYFNNAPNDQAFHAEAGRLLENIHTFDVLRSDRSISANGLEARTPFLDKQFVAVAKSISTNLRRPTKNQCEKWVLRKAFEGVLPDEILWRKKEAFSDGVSGAKPWYQECQERALQEVSDDWQKIQWKWNAPKTAEGYYYRVLYDRYYGWAERTIPYFWMPRWCPGTTDPSARTLRLV
jgi:asparagine synthase (glutamine-hydrolysing)